MSVFAQKCVSSPYEGVQTWPGLEDFLTKLVCRKCNVEVHATDFEEVAAIQLMTCGGGGTHRLVGVA